METPRSAMETSPLQDFRPMWRTTVMESVTLRLILYNHEFVIQS
jgi:hypothetical protein